MTSSGATALRLRCALAAASLLPMFGCTFEPVFCNSDADCPAQSYCARPDGEASAVCLSAHLNEPDAGPADDSDDVTGPHDDSATDEDFGGMGVPGACSPARNCSHGGEGGSLNEDPFGCPRSEFVPFQTTVQGAVCADSWNWYELEFVRCRDSAIEVEIVLQAGVDCARDFALRVNDEGYTCGRDGMECEQRGDGRHIVRLPIAPSDFPTPVEALSFSVDSAAAQDYEFTLDVTVRR